MHLLICAMKSVYLTLFYRDMGLFIYWYFLDWILSAEFFSNLFKRHVCKIGLKMEIFIAL